MIKNVISANKSLKIRKFFWTLAGAVLVGILAFVLISFLTGEIKTENMYWSLLVAVTLGIYMSYRMIELALELALASYDPHSFGVKSSLQPLEKNRQIISTLQDIPVSNCKYDAPKNGHLFLKPGSQPVKRFESKDNGSKF